MSEIRATSHFDAPTLKLGSAMHMRYRHPLFVVIRYCYLALVPIGIALIVAGDPQFGILCILIGPILFLRKIFWQYRLIQGSKSSPQAGQALDWSFSDSIVAQKSEGHEKEFRWKQFGDRYLSPKGILLYLEKDQYFILPRTAFANQGDFEKVSRLCETKIAVD